ncbi:MFS transporter [Caldisphaera sp.]|uniref:MFS transporter n=1 Tax=Caldisphaera sp. TaxID=2060322 RepID=UPI0025C27191|nr:MFS transporter [Caldisphaera sp.]
MQNRYMKDIYLLALVRSIRSFSFGYIAFLLPLYLKFIGFSTTLVGFYALAATISSSILVLISGYLGDLYSRKKTLIIMSFLPAIAYIILIISHNIIIAFLSSMFGLSLSPMGGGAGGGPVAPLQTAMVASRTNKEERTKIYSYLTMIAIIMAMSGSFLSSYIIKAFPKNYYYYLFDIAIALSLFSIILLFFISEKPDKFNYKADFMPKKSAKNISKVAIAGLFGSLGLGIVLPLLPLYFKHIGANDYEISIIYDLSYMATSIALLLSNKLQHIFGYIKSILILRSVGSLPLFLIPLIHSIVIDAGIYILRTAFYQAALPIRQNVSMELYSPEERSRGSSITGIARRLPYGAATTIGSILFQIGMYFIAFFAASIISFLDPILYYLFFKEIDNKNKLILN